MRKYFRTSSPSRGAKECPPTLQWTARTGFTRRKKSSEHKDGEHARSEERHKDGECYHQPNEGVVGHWALLSIRLDDPSPTWPRSGKRRFLVEAVG
jgi:hypothetical protein